MDSGFLVEAALEMLRGGGISQSRWLTDDMQREGRCGLGGLCASNRFGMSFFHAFSLSVSWSFLRWTHAAQCRAANVPRTGQKL